MEEGRGYRADGFYEGFLDRFAKAEQIFRETSQLENAAFCLEEMTRLEEAGGDYKPSRPDLRQLTGLDMWVEIGQLKKAASLFMQSESWLKAFNCYDLLKLFNDAAQALFQGKVFNKLVKYLAEYAQTITCDPCKVLRQTEIEIR
jgi:hypothetical protein